MLDSLGREDQDDAYSLSAEAPLCWPERVVVGGIPTARIDLAGLARLITQDVMVSRSPEARILAPRLIFSSNGSVIARYNRDETFRTVLNQADIIDADGMSIVFASKLLNKRPIRSRVATTDLIHPMSRFAEKYGIRFFFLGSTEESVRAAKLYFQKSYPGLQIVGIRSGFFSKDKEASICKDIVRAQTDILWVGMGSPLQECFAIRCREMLTGVRWIRTCGGLFDHYNGSNVRAPQWMQLAGLEWLFRVLREPLRLGPRYVSTNLPASYYLLTKTPR